MQVLDEDNFTKHHNFITTYFPPIIRFFNCNLLLRASSDITFSYMNMVKIEVYKLKHKIPLLAKLKLITLFSVSDIFERFCSYFLI